MKRIRRSGVVLGAATLLVTGLMAVTSSISEATVAPHVTVKAMGAGGYITTTTEADGDVTKIYSSDPMTVAPATELTRTASDGTVTREGGAEITPRITDAQGVAEKSANGTLSSTELTPDATDELAAMGVDSSETIDYVSLNAASTGITGAPIHDTSNGVRPAAAAASSVRHYDTTCYDHTTDGGKMHIHGCDAQYVVHDYGNGNQYMLDKFLATATMHDTSFFNPDEVTGLIFGDHYGANNVIQVWKPVDTQDAGSCQTKTTTLSFAGQSFSTSGQACPETWGAYSITNTQFLTKWDGQGSGPNNGARATWGENGVHSPSNGSIHRGIYVHWYYD